jgi:hypothetical protein
MVPRVFQRKGGDEIVRLAGEIEWSIQKEMGHTLIKEIGQGIKFQLLIYAEGIRWQAAFNGARRI